MKNSDIAAVHWCETARTLTSNSWHYLKVLQKEFEELRPDNFADLSALSTSTHVP